MRSFRNNNKRSRYRSNGDRNFKRNGESHSYAGNTNFQRRSPGRNNQNASQLIEKYTDLAREALSNGDKILSENYFQHSDHFLRIINAKDNGQIIENNQQNKKIVSEIEKLEENQKPKDTTSSN